jgi:hypothetical protein
MCRLHLVEAQGGGDRVQDLVGDSGDVAALDPDVVLGAHPGQQRDLLTAQAGDPPTPSGRKPDLVRGDLRAARHQEVPDVPLAISTAPG